MLKTKVDLTKYLDVFVITNGRESFDYVIKTLENQINVKFNLVIFRDMPWLDACNACLNYSDLPFYIRIDDDMLLHPYTLQFFDYTLKTKEDAAAIIYHYRLWEPWNKRLCGGLKVYNRELSKVIGFEVDDRGKVDKIFKKKALKKNYKYVGSNSSAVGIHAACSFDENMKYIKLRDGERNKIDFEIRKKELVKLDEVYKNCSLDKQVILANKGLYKENKKRNSLFFKFIEESRR